MNPKPLRDGEALPTATDVATASTVREDAAMKLFAVIVNRDDTIRVASAEVVKETPQFYYIKRDRGMAWNDPRREDQDAFGYSERIPKERAFTTARAVLESYMEKRRQHIADAKSVIGQATKQVASANELLMHLPEESQAVNAGATPLVEGVTASAQDSSSSVTLAEPAART